MAYRLRFQINYISPMREKHQYIVYIYEDGYTGSSVRVLDTALDALTLTYGRRDWGELDPILPSELTMCLMNTDSLDLTGFYTEDPLKFRVELVRVDNGVIWRGYISSGVYSQPYAPSPYQVEIRANDGFEVLRNIDFLNAGERYSGFMSIDSILAIILAKLYSTVTLNVWGVDPIYTEQTASTTRLSGMFGEAIYTVFENKVPSCYEVLEAVLRNFRLQLFKGWGTTWYARSVAALAGNARPAWYPTSLGYASTNARPLTQSLDDRIMTTATLSMLPPMRRLNLTIGNSGDIESNTAAQSMLDASRWKIESYYTGSPFIELRPNVRSTGSGLRIFMTNYSPVTNDPARRTWIGYAFDGSIVSSPNCSITFRANVYNMGKTAAYLNFSFFVVGDITSPLSWLTADDSNTITFPKTCANFNPASGGWINRSGMSVSTTAATPWLFSESVAVEKGTQVVPWEKNVSLKNRAPYNLELNIPTMDFSAFGFGDAPLRMVMVITCPSNLDSTIELAEPSFEISYGDISYDGVTEEEMMISRYGSEAQEFKQLFPEGGYARAAGGSFVPSTVVSTGRGVAGYIAPTTRFMLSDIVASELRQLRGCVRRQLEGEMIGNHDDLNSVWRNGIGFCYYANYIQHNFRRGTMNVQLRELPSPLNQSVTVSVLSDVSYTERPIAFDTTMMYVVGTTVYLFDVVSKAVREVYAAGKVEMLALWKSADSAVVVTYIGDTWQLRAFDAMGNLRSKIDDLFKVVTVPTSVSMYVAMAMAARYDSVTRTWVIIGNVDDSTANMQLTLVDSDGGAIKEVTSANYGRIEGVPEIFNGGVAFTGRDVTTGACSVYWHQHDRSKDLSCDVVLSNSILKAVTDTAMYAQTTTAPTLLYVVRRGVDGVANVAMTSFPNTLAFINANNALMLMSNLSATGGVVLYDLRTGQIRSATLPAMFALPVLVGDKICSLYGDARIVITDTNVL